MNSGTTGGGKTKMPSARSGNFATCSPSPPRTRSHRRPRGRVQARNPAVLLLAHRPGRSRRSHSAAVGALAARSENTSGYELEDPLEEDKDSPVPGLTHRYPDRCSPGHDPRLHHVLPLLHAQAGHHGSRRLGRHQPRRRADDRVRSPPSRDSRRHRLRRRSADLALRKLRFFLENLATSTMWM